MKLNLIPSKINKEGSPTAAWIIGVLLILITVGVSAVMATASAATLAAATARAERAKPGADQARETATLAQSIVDSTKVFATNIELKKAMDAQNSKYPNFYKRIDPYIPSFMRVTRKSIEPIDANSCRLTLGSVLYSAQQHADATLALLRIPGAKSVTRTQYNPRPIIVPNLTEDDQKGRPYRTGGTRPSEDPIERMNAMLAAAAGENTGFANVGNFGSPDPLPRGPMPLGQAVTYTILLVKDGSDPTAEGWDFNFLTPNPTATIASLGAGGAPSALNVPNGGAPNPNSDAINNRPTGNIPGRPGGR